MAKTLLRADIRTIAFAAATRNGRTSRLGYLSADFSGLNIGDVLALDNEDLGNYDEDCVSIIAHCNDGVVLSKDSKTKMRNLFGALLRECRKAHGDNADLRAVYGLDVEVDEDDNVVAETPYYAVERVK